MRVWWRGIFVLLAGMGGWGNGLAAEAGALEIELTVGGGGSASVCGGVDGGWGGADGGDGEVVGGEAEV